MFHLRLIKAMSYMGCGLSVTKKNPDVSTDDKAQAEALIKSGYFQLVEGGSELKTPEQQSENNSTGEGEDESIPDGILPEPDEGMGEENTAGEGENTNAPIPDSILPEPDEGTGEENTTGEGENVNAPIPNSILPEPDESTGEKKTGKTLDDMTRAELETFATYKNVSVKGLPKKADIIAKLREVLGPEETSGVIKYGSPTMVELQQQ